jgi:hypothetical protein
MLNNLTNFLNIIAGRRTKTQLEPSDIIAVGTKQSPARGDYKPTAIKFEDLQTQLGAPQFKSVSTTQGTTITGVTGIRVSSSVLIPKGTLNVDETIIEIMVGGFREAGSNTVQLMIYLNDTNSLTGATLMATGLNYTSNNWNGKMLRTFPLTNGVLTTTVAPGFLAMIDTTTPQTPSTYSYDPVADDLYVILAMNNLATNNISYTNFHKIICY